VVARRPDADPQLRAEVPLLLVVFFLNQKCKMEYKPKKEGEGGKKEKGKGERRRR
jgi:hypothetical protein